MPSSPFLFSPFLFLFFLPLVCCVLCCWMLPRLLHPPPTFSPFTPATTADTETAGGAGGGEQDGGRSSTPRSPQDAAEAERLAAAFDGEVTTQLQKNALSKGLDKDEVEAARVAATLAVREAMRGPGNLPPPSPEAYLSQACGVRVKSSLPLYHNKGQRCCKASQLPQPGAPGASPVKDSLALADGGTGLGLGEDGAGGGPQEVALPGVLRGQRTGAAGDQEVSCFPSFIIAGTQKSGTTALTGKKGACRRSSCPLPLRDR